MQFRQNREMPKLLVRTSWSEIRLPGGARLQRFQLSGPHTFCPARYSEFFFIAKPVRTNKLIFPSPCYISVQSA